MNYITNDQMALNSRFAYLNLFLSMILGPEHGKMSLIQSCQKCTISL